MFRIFQKIALSSLSVLFCSLLVWILILTNPQWSYAHSTQFDVLTVHHDQPLATGTAEVLNASLKIIKRSPLFQEGMRIQLCLNDGSSYPGFNPLAGLSLAYATLQISTINQCELDFDQNRASTSWAINDYETRTYNLTWLLAHEFTHNLQYKRKAGYVIASTLGKINWKLEGHAEYTARQYRDDGLLQSKIAMYQEEEAKEHLGLPAFQLEDGTTQILPYFKYALMVQYLLEVEGQNFDQLCRDKRSQEEVYKAMLQWNGAPNAN